MRRREEKEMTYAKGIIGLAIFALIITVVVISAYNIHVAQVRVDKAKEELRLAQIEVQEQLYGLDSSMQELNQKYTN